MKTAKDLELLLLVKEKKIQDLILELEHEKSTVAEYGKRLIKAIEYIEYYLAKGKTKSHRKFDTSVLDILKGVDKE